jgi:hypothetical protein
MADVQTSEMDAKLAPANVGALNYVYCRSSKDETIFVKNKKYEHGGQLNVKIHSLFCGDNS